MRLVTPAVGDRRLAARRFLRNGPEHGIDHSLMWASFSPGGQVREVCLAVIGSGRTATMFLAPPLLADESPEQVRERAAAVDAACNWLEREAAGRVCLAQHLPEPDHRWAVEACCQAGFQRISTLSYLERSLSASRAPPALPPEIRCVGLNEFSGEPAWAPVLERVLDATYEHTLDCPELCGMRGTADVIASHQSVGVWDPSRWWLVYHRDEPAGCILLNHCSAQRAVELVYLGLTPSLRGRGLAGSLLETALHAVSELPADRVTCAVDDRNEPALRLYRSLGFAPFAHRVALVRRIGSHH